LRICTLLGTIFTLLIIFTHGQVNFLGHTTDISIWFVVLLGLANSLVWAGIWPLALDDLGRFTKLGASVMIMGLCGNAIMPLFYGHFADVVNVREAYWVLLPCYLYLVFYAVKGGWRMGSLEVGYEKCQSERTGPPGGRRQSERVNVTPAPDIPYCKAPSYMPFDYAQGDKRIGE
jgi:hypothetical protein